jgi:3-methyladenine DNA glycosylase/8-oxoguanine DNA glycosylase
VRAAVAALAARDPVIAGLVDAHGPCRLGTRPTANARFTSLARSIVFQQLAGAAASTIWGRFLAAAGEPLTPEAVLALPDEALRAAGLSTAKSAAVRDLAARLADGRLDLRRIGGLDDEAVIAELVTVRGVGRWTAEMFCIFALHRLDVWPVDDLGVRHGFGAAHGIEMPTRAELATEGDRFRPYRSVAAWYCWRASEAARRAGRANGSR